MIFRRAKLSCRPILLLRFPVGSACQEALKESPKASVKIIKSATESEGDEKVTEATTRPPKPTTTAKPEEPDTEDNEAPRT